MWDAPSGAGTVTSVAAGAGLTTGGGPITGSGTISLAAVANLSLLASISAMTFAGPRVYFAMGRDGVFFSRAAAVHPRYRTPVVSILAQATWSAVLVLTASADALVTYTGFAIVLFSGVAVVSLFVLRAREPQADRPFRAWGYPVAPAIYIAASAAILLNAVVSQPGPTRNGALVMLAGVPLYLLFRKNVRSKGTESQRVLRNP